MSSDRFGSEDLRGGVKGVDLNSYRSYGFPCEVFSGFEFGMTLRSLYIIVENKVLSYMEMMRFGCWVLGFCLM